MVLGYICVFVFCSAVKVQIMFNEMCRLLAQNAPIRMNIDGGLCLFQPHNAKPHSACIMTACLCSKRVWVLNQLACAEVKNIRHNIK